MTIEFKDLGNIESNYGSMSEDYDSEEYEQFLNGRDEAIPVKSDIEDYCAICDAKKATLELTYLRNKKHFKELLCNECYHSEEYQEMLSSYETIKLIPI